LYIHKYSEFKYYCELWARDLRVERHCCRSKSRGHWREIS